MTKTKVRIASLQAQLKEAKDEIKTWDEGVINPTCASYQKQIASLEAQLKTAKQEVKIIEVAKLTGYDGQFVIGKVILDEYVEQRKQIATLTADKERLEQQITPLQTACELNVTGYKTYKAKSDGLEKQNKILADALNKLAKSDLATAAIAQKALYDASEIKEKRDCGDPDG